MPRIEIEKGHEEVDADCGGRRDNEIGEDVVAEVKGGFWVLELYDYDIKGCKDRICHYDGIADKTAHEHFLGPGRLFSSRLKEHSELKLTLGDDYPSKE